MNFDNLDDSNFLLFAAKYYDNIHCFEIEEFNEDLNRFKYVKRLFNRYEETGELKERLLLNHIIIIYNVFGVEAATRMLFLKLEGQYQLLKPFLILLNYMPEKVPGINGKDIIGSEIGLDQNVVNKLRKI